MRPILLIAFILISYFSAQSQTVILNEDFQLGFPAAWKTVINDTSTVHTDVSEFTDAWIIKENPDTLGDSVIAATSYFQNGGQASRWVITNQIQLGMFGNYMKWDVKSHDPSFPDGYLVLISTTNDSLHNFTDTLFFTDFEVPVWTTREYNLVDSIYAGMQIYIAFVNDSDNQFILYLDNVVVTKDSPLSTKENLLTDIVSTVYPNPFQHEIRIATNNEVSSLTLLGINGRIIKEINNESYSINGLENIESGVYFLNIRYKNGLEEFKKLIKE